MNDTRIEEDRVRRHTAPKVNQRIDEEIRETVACYAQAGENELSQRIGALEAEWDIERVLETNASSLALAGILSAALGHRRGLLLAGGVMGFLLLHGTQGWCPPLPVLRRLGVRTRQEIEREKFVLRYLRGDFAGLGPAKGRRATRAVLAAAAR